MLGKLSWSAIPLDQPIPLVTSFVVIAAILGLLGWVTVKGWWPKTPQSTRPSNSGTSLRKPAGK